MSDLFFGLLLGPILFVVSIVMFRMTSGRDGSGQPWQGYVDPVLLIPGVLLVAFMNALSWLPRQLEQDRFEFRLGLLLGALLCAATYIEVLRRAGSPTLLTRSFAVVILLVPVLAFARLLV